MMVGKVTNNEIEPIEFMNGKCTKFDEITIEPSDELEPGEYIAFVEVDWSQNRIKEFVFSTYS